MREAHILLIDGAEETSNLENIHQKLLKYGSTRVIHTRSAEEIYKHISEHRLTDIAVLNGSASFPRNIGQPHLPGSPYRIGIELAEHWQKPVILCAPSPSDDKIEYWRKYAKPQTKSPNNPSGFIAASCDSVLAEIAFLTRVMHDLRPIKLPQTGLAIAPRNTRPTGHILDDKPSFFRCISNEIQERFELFLASKEASRR
jgi:hypothetical protein